MRRREAWLNSMLAGLPTCAGGIILLLLSFKLCVALVLTAYAAGLLDLIYAKWPQWSARKFTTWGPSSVFGEHRAAYFRAYRRLGCGMSLNVVLILFYGNWCTGS